LESLVEFCLKEPPLFTIDDRNRVRDQVLEWAAADPRVVSGAVVGSLALSAGDRWSDLDLTFGVADDASLQAVLADWTHRLENEFQAARLFDLPSGPSIYRVFLLPGCLQFDLSFTPAAQFGATGPKFRLLFGSAIQKPFPAAPEAQELAGYGAHHALRARFCIERGRLWQAEYWISSLRDISLQLACLRLNLSTAYGRGFDDLPAELLAHASESLVRSLNREDLLRAFRNALADLLREARLAQALANPVDSELRKLLES
jgi:hypothetical protein